MVERNICLNSLKKYSFKKNTVIFLFFIYILFLVFNITSLILPWYTVKTDIQYTGYTSHTEDIYGLFKEIYVGPSGVKVDIYYLYSDSYTPKPLEDFFIGFAFVQILSPLFVLISLLCFILTLRNHNPIRIVNLNIVVSVGINLLHFILVIGFFGIQSKFAESSSVCIFQCKSFSGSETLNGIQKTWGPSSGYFVCVGSFILSFIHLLFIIPRCFYLRELARDDENEFDRHYRSTSINSHQMFIPLSDTTSDQQHQNSIANQTYQSTGYQSQPRNYTNIIIPKNLDINVNSWYVIIPIQTPVATNQNQTGSSSTTKYIEQNVLQEYSTKYKIPILPSKSSHLPQGVVIPPYLTIDANLWYQFIPHQVPVSNVKGFSSQYVQQYILQVYNPSCKNQTRTPPQK